MAQNQTSICGLRRMSPSPKIKFGFTCQPRNPNTEASRSLSSFAQSPDCEAWQVALLCISATLSIPGRPSGGVVGYAASHRAVREMKEDGELPRRVKVRSNQYLNNLVEQDHRRVKQRI